jgi:hypothetical protein
LRICDSLFSRSTPNRRPRNILSATTANVDGNYDKRGLPDPLVLAFYFTIQSDLIVQLIILRNRYDI